MPLTVSAANRSLADITTETFVHVASWSPSPFSFLQPPHHDFDCQRQTSVYLGVLSRSRNSRRTELYGTARAGASGFDCVQNGKPGSYGNLPTVALNAAQELANNRAACGMCILLAGTGSGAGANPVSTTPTKYVVSNQCPECAYGSIDIATNGNGSGRPGLDGRWQITWSFVSCGSKRKSSLRRAMLGIEDSSSRHDFSSEVDPEELAALTWQTGQARSVAS
ncbi:hypothetical protein WJX84_008747 [Apatococcus fuscideae]|uniref:Uncharacterized protein n=1 Tax=Apatococcus fuscideae TaxID=2026836 RepID=A0AAW1TDM9_9CHLO